MAQKRYKILAAKFSYSESICGLNSLKYLTLSLFFVSLLRASPRPRGHWSALCGPDLNLFSAACVRGRDIEIEMLCVNFRLVQAIYI